MKRIVVVMMLALMLFGCREKKKVYYETDVEQVPEQMSPYDVDWIGLFIRCHELDSIKSVAEVNVAVMGMMVIMMPIFFFAMYEKNGRPLEVYLGHFIEAIFIRPKKRPYKTDNYYAALMRLAKTEQEVEEIVRASMEQE